MSVVRGRVFAGPPWEFHMDSSRRIMGDGERHFCTRRCHRLRTWYYEVERDGKVVASDNTGNWQVILDACIEAVEAERELL